MANVKISELSPLVTVQDADVLPIVDNAVTKKVTAAILRSYTQGNSVLLTGNQTVAGIKTFTSQLASSVATGTAPFSVASTTKVTNLNADLLDGLSSADFATLTGTQTLTNKTITSPIINEILDSNGNEILGFTPIASATDYITIKNGIGVGVPLHISAAGSSANTGIHLEPKGTGLVQISDGTDTTKGFRFRSSASATGAVTLIDAVSSAGRVITLPNATTTLVGTNTTDTLTNKSISGDTNTLSNIGNASLTNSAITINGTSTSLGGSINVGTVTSVAALTLGTSGTDLTSTVATGTTTPVITLNVPTASASNRGALSSTDWSTFNAKQNAITLTTTGTSGAATLVGSTLNIPNYADTDTGITSLNGLTALTQTFAVGTSGTDFGISSATSTHTFNLPTASATNRGALSSADWTTFNNKQNALTNPITGTGTTNYLPKFTGASALGNSVIYDSGTKIGIGNTAPGAKLEITSTALGSEGLRVDGDGAGFAFVVKGGTDYTSHIRAGATIGVNYFTTPPSNGLIVEGSVGIGTTSPAQKLDVFGNARVSNTTPLLELFNTTNGDVWSSLQAVASSGSGSDLIFSTKRNGDSLTEKLRITAAGAATFSSSVTATEFIGIDNATLTADNFTTNATVLTLNSKGTVGTIKLQTNSTDRLTIASSGVSTFSGNVNINNAPNDADIAMTIQASAGSNKFLLFGRDSSSSAVCNISSAGAATFSSVKATTGVAISGATAPASGIEFPATQVASASANNLDDYEEGTWTMGVSFGGASTGVTYSLNTGNYTKIGRQVTVTGYVTLTSKGSSTGVAKITGLPFTIGNNNNSYTAASFWFATISFVNQYQGYGNINETTIDLRQITSLGVESGIYDTDFANNSRFMVTLTYFV